MNVTRELEIMECPFCFITFGVPKRLLSAKQQNGTDFWCPNGHSLSYTDNENDRLKRERDRLVQRLAQRDDEIRTQTELITNLKTQRIAVAKRSAAGVCQCCHRTFSQLARHMAAKHPEFKAVAVVK